MGDLEDKGMAEVKLATEGRRREVWDLEHERGSFAAACFDGGGLAAQERDGGGGRGDEVLERHGSRVRGGACDRGPVEIDHVDRAILALGEALGHRGAHHVGSAFRGVSAERETRGVVDRLPIDRQPTPGAQKRLHHGGGEAAVPRGSEVDLNHA